MLALKVSEKKPPKKEIAIIPHESLYRLVGYIRQGWAVENVRKLTEGVRVQVWLEVAHNYSSRNRIRPYDATIVRQLSSEEREAGDAGPTFKVTWATDKKSTQLFKPHLDEWSFTE